MTLSERRFRSGFSTNFWALKVLSTAASHTATPLSKRSIPQPREVCFANRLAYRQTKPPRRQRVPDQKITGCTRPSVSALSTEGLRIFWFPPIVLCRRTVSREETEDKSTGLENGMSHMSHILNEHCQRKTRRRRRRRNLLQYHRSLKFFRGRCFVLFVCWKKVRFDPKRSTSIEKFDRPKNVRRQVDLIRPRSSLVMSL